MSTDKNDEVALAYAKEPGMFQLPSGKNVLFTFILVSSLFLLWGFLNGMIDTMDKHFQEELGLTLAQSATVQFAHYLGYFLMSIPAGWLATKLGYKGGIIFGLLIVALGGIWFVPATKIAQFWAFLLGVALIASGLTFLETVANPYTTVLGNKRYAATRINLAQSCNGIGWILGPIAGGLFFYGKDAAGKSTGSETLYIPYLFSAVIVILLAVSFWFADVPDVKAEDDYHIGDKDADPATRQPDRQVNRAMTYLMLTLNATAMCFVIGTIIYTFLTIFNFKAYRHDTVVYGGIMTGAIVLAVIAAFALIPLVKKLSHHSAWSHSHFSGATLAQFFYVAAQAGIFSFFINYMTSQVPEIPKIWNTEFVKKHINTFEVNTRVTGDEIKDMKGLIAKIKGKADPVSAMIWDNLSEETIDDINAMKDPSDLGNVKTGLIQDLNKVVKANPKDLKVKKKKGPSGKADGPEIDQVLYKPERFTDVTLSAETRKLAESKPEGENRARLNRMLLVDAYPNEMSFKDNVLCISDKGAAFLSSIAFGFFLLGRFTGAGLLKKYSAHKVLGLYGLLNVIICGLIFMKFGWFSVICVFLSYLFMSIMFPTIFALGIFGLGERAKGASAYIVMAIMGGAILPKLMGSVGDHHGMSRAFIVPLGCFALVSLYGYLWPALSGSDSMHGSVKTSGH